MRLGQSVIESFPDEEHVFDALQLGSDWYINAGKEYRKQRAGRLKLIKDVKVDGITILDTAKLEAIISNATIPDTTDDPKDIVRSDMGEVIAHILLEDIYKTSFGHKSVSTRERHDMAGRGIDCVGIEEGEKLTLILGEVKVSDETGRLPQVVDTSKDSLSKSLCNHIKKSNRGATTKKIWTVIEKTENEDTRNKLIEAALYWEQEFWSKLRVVCTAVMVRPKNLYQAREFGSLRRNPKKVNPGVVRFLIVNIEESTLEAKARFLDAAKEAGEN